MTFEMMQKRKYITLGIAFLSADLEQINQAKASVDTSVRYVRTYSVNCRILLFPSNFSNVMP